MLLPPLPRLLLWWLCRPPWWWWAHVSPPLAAGKRARYAMWWRMGGWRLWATGATGRAVKSQSTESPRLVLGGSKRTDKTTRRQSRMLLPAPPSLSQAHCPCDSRAGVCQRPSVQTTPSLPMRVSMWWSQQNISHPSRPSPRGCRLCKPTVETGLGHAARERAAVVEGKRCFAAEVDGGIKSSIPSPANVCVMPFASRKILPLAAVQESQWSWSDTC